MNEELKKKALTLIYFMQKECARESWVDFLDYLGITIDEAKDIFRHIAKDSNIDGKQFYFKVE